MPYVELPTILIKLFEYCRQFPALIAFRTKIHEALMSTFSPQDGFPIKRLAKYIVSYFVSILLFLIGHVITAS